MTKLWELVTMVTAAIAEKVGIETTNHNETIDGLRSTYATISENATLDIKLRYKYENIGGVGLKFKGGPYKFSVQGKEFTSGLVGDQVQPFKFDHFATDTLSVKALQSMEVITVEVYTQGAAVRSPLPFTCIVVPTGTIGRRWQCTSGDGTKTWLAGPEYKYQGLLAYQAPFDNNTPPVEGPPAPAPSPQPEPPSPAPSPAPTGSLPYTPKAGSKVYEDYKWWGRHTTTYASGGSGPSERWNSAAPYLNIMSTFDIELGAKVKSMDNGGVKFRGGAHDDANGGWYLTGITFDKGEGIFGKEYPHPSTNHYDSHVTAGSIGSIVGKRIAFCGVCYNDADGNPVTEAYAKANPADAKWTFLGKIKDTGQLKPGPKLDKIGVKGSKTQQVQIRIDEAPDAKIYNGKVYEIEPPKNP